MTLSMSLNCTFHCEYTFEAYCPACLFTLYTQMSRLPVNMSSFLPTVNNLLIISDSK